MSLLALHEARFDAHYQRERDRPGDLWVFLHIPKTAGSSFRQELAQRLRPEVNLVGSHDNDGRPQIEKTRAALQAFLERLPAQPHRFASGHLRRSDLQAIRRAHPRSRFITMLREPVARVISDYRYMRTPAHPTWQEVIARYPTIEDYLRDPRTQDKMFRFLRRRPTDGAEQVIEDLEQHFSFVGTVEQYALSCRLLFRLLGIAGEPAVYQRRTEDRADNQIEDLAQARALAAALNPRDQAIWRHFHDRLGAIAAPLEAWLSATSVPAAAPAAGRA